MTDLRKRRDALFNPDAFPNVAAVQLKWAEIEKEQVEFVNRVTNESLEKMIPFRTTQIRLLRNLPPAPHRQVEILTAPFRNAAHRHLRRFHQQEAQ